jgi:hypothetical protein
MAKQSDADGQVTDDKVLPLGPMAPTGKGALVAAQVVPEPDIRSG